MPSGNETNPAGTGNGMGGKITTSKTDRLPSPPKQTRVNPARAMLAGSLSELDVPRNTEAFNLPIDKLVPNPNQPRQTYNAEQEQELAESIQAQGILQPLIVRKVAGGVYQIVAGERRYRAAKAVGLSHVPVILKEYSDTQARLVSLVENLQRTDLDPSDEARYYRYLISEFNLSQLEIADFVHRSRSYVQGRLRQLEEYDEAQDSAGTSDMSATEGENSSSSLSSELQEGLPLSNAENRKQLHSPANKDNFLKFARIFRNKKNLQKPLSNFTAFLDAALDQAPTLKGESKQYLAEQLKELRTRIELLEKNLDSSANSNTSD